VTDTASATGSRPHSPIDDVADRYVEDYCSLDPLTATFLGVAGHDDEVTDLSPAGVDERTDLGRRLLAQVDALDPVDDVDLVTKAAMRDRIGLELELHEAGLAYADLNVIASPVQGLREVFDLMGTQSAEDWATVATRLGRVGDGLAGYRASLERSVRDGHAPAGRQVEACAKQADEFGDVERGFFRRLVDGARPGGSEPDEALAADLRRGAQSASAAYAELAGYLREGLLPKSRSTDAVGREQYALWSRLFVGARVDLEETYAWGREELARIEAGMQTVAEQIVPGGSVAHAVAALEKDPARTIAGKEAFRRWMQDKSDAAVAALADVHFDIPEPVRRLECMIAPTTSGGIYYTGPSEDFSRPGRMWWAVPEGITEFATWRQTTTVFHEGVPGHHLQVAQTMYRRELLNRWRRLFAWCSGHGEGWALYAERLMADLGWLDDPGDRLGMLEGSRFRAMRVVVDIGTHCGFDAPDEVGGDIWDADKMWTFMRAHTLEEEPFLRFEHQRYLGWPGQAPSYKVGERLWLQIRERVQEREKNAFDLKAFHRRALDVGSLPLDVLREALT
jgi:uncharacterized protein (DUF885 family)